MSLNNTTIPAAVIMSCLAQPLLASETIPSIQLEQDTETVIITTSRFESEANQLPSHVTVITKQEIEQLSATDLSQVLRRVPGVQVSNTNGKTSISMRGISAEQSGSNVLVLVDGQRLNKTDLASPDIDTINIIDIERIEIIQGAGSSLYGDQAVAGVINIITHSGQKQTKTLRYAQGVFEHKQTAANLGFQLDEQWSVVLKGHKKDTDNYRVHNELSHNQLGAELFYQDNQQQWRFSHRTRNETQQTPGALLESDLVERRQSRPEFANDYVSTDEYFSRIFGQINLNSQWQFALDVNHQESDIQSINSFINFATSNVNQTQRSQSAIYPRIKGGWNTDNGPVQWITGVDYDKSDYEFSLLARSNEQTMGSLYSQFYWPLSAHVELELATRLAEVEDQLTDAALYPQGVVLDNSASAFDIGFSYQISSAKKSFIRYSNNYRFAKVDEQAYTPEGVLGLEPQTGQSLEAGFSSQFETGSLQTSIYQLKLADEIIFDPSATPPAGAFFPGANINGSESTRLGLLLDYRYFIDENEVGFSYHWVDAEIDSSERVVPSVSENTVTGWFDWQLTSDFNWYIEAHHRSDRYQDGDTANSLTKVGAYTSLNSALVWRFDNARLGLRIDNLLDKEYIDYAQFNGYYPAKGRDLIVTFDLVF